MLFYDCSTAPSPRRARMFIAEKGLKIESREISLAEKEQLSPAFLAVNPRATVPVLITRSGATLTENLAIATYLEAVSPNPPLLGETADEKAQVMQWNALVEQQGGLPIADVLRNSNKHMRGRALTGPVNFEQIPELAERGRLRVGLFFDLLEQRLSQSAYLAGERLTMADITGFVFVDFARVIKASIPDTSPATRAWFDAIKAHPSASL
ncbi:glutathione S-transferase [Pararhodobacter sp.]|uniref:glutathione S-transferase family protein n=1 Tax=Pararhodobacter sp. TaxID=2127056 RepID=UPI002AFF25AC|nr:glutathione S-transferase [Pararhodobacter sp.]